MNKKFFEEHYKYGVHYNLKSAVKNYKLYRKHNRVWYDNSAEELDRDIKEIEEKLLFHEN